MVFFVAVQGVGLLLDMVIQRRVKIFEKSLYADI